MPVAMVQAIYTSTNADAKMKQDFLVYGMAKDTEANIRIVLQQLTEYQALVVEAKPTTKRKADYNMELLKFLQSKKILSFKDKKKGLLDKGLFSKDAEIEFL